MSREVYVLRNGKLVLKHLAAPREGNSAPYVIPDGLGATLEHTAYSDGRSTDSKSQYRAWTAQAGCVEKGNDRERPSSGVERVTSREIGEAIAKVNGGYRPFERT